MHTRYAEAWQRDAAAFAEALFATKAGGPPDERVAWLVDDLAHFLGLADARPRLLFRGSLAAVVRAAPAAIFKLRPFATLPLDQRIRALERLEHGPFALPMFAVKTMLSFIWYEHPDSAVEVGLVRNVRALPRQRPPRGPK